MELGCVANIQNNDDGLCLGVEKTEVLYIGSKKDVWRYIEHG